MQQNDDPHAHEPVLRAGTALTAARLVTILLHGRGAGAEDILELSREFSPTDVAYLAPQASERVWYPYSFLAPMEQNEPGISSGFRVIAGLVQELQQQNVSSDRVVLMGFSQGACLALEFAVRHPRRYAAIVAFSGGLIGPPGTPRNYPGGFEGTPVFVGCSNVDAHIPLDRVHESTGVFRRMGATVDERIYSQMGHTVNRDELDAVDALLSKTSQ